MQFKIDVFQSGFSIVKCFAARWSRKREPCEIFVQYVGIQLRKALGGHVARSLE